jgi:hypothetical protein
MRLLTRYYAENGAMYKFRRRVKQGTRDGRQPTAGTYPCSLATNRSEEKCFNQSGRVSASGYRSESRTS